MANKFLRFKPSEWDYQACYDILQTRPEETPKQACLETLEAVGQLYRYNTLVTGPLRVALGARLHSVHEYSMEFYSSFAFKAKAEPFDEEGVQFRCVGEVLSISIVQFGVNVGLFTEEASVEEENTGGLRELPNNMRQTAWA
ncbi:hypothetical protein HanLR1_Chr11g0408101 [Helianthus annuus]|nr:hypothetical protein HanLR1_Chr11g0408101 [Helianthus annuus]